MIAAITALTQDETREKCIQSGCDRFIAKPYSREDLAGLIAALVEEPLHSTLADCEDLTPTIDAFVLALSGRVRALEESLVKNDASTVESVARTLKGEGSACGFEPITEEAAKIENELINGATLDSLHDRVVALRVLESTLRERGFEVLCAVNGADAFRIVTEVGPPLVITDWIMPEVDGLELCRRLRSCDGIGFTYIILLTANTAKEQLVQGFEAGMDAYLSKPLDFETLRRTINRFAQDIPARAAPSVQKVAKHDTLSRANILDSDALVESCQGDSELVYTVAAVFSDEAPKMLAQVCESVRSGDRTGIAKAAHKLKGALGILCAKTAYEEAATLEEACECASIDQLAEIADRLTDEAQQVRAELRELAEKIRRTQISCC